MLNPPVDEIAGAEAAADGAGNDEDGISQDRKEKRAGKAAEYKAREDIGKESELPRGHGDAGEAVPEKDAYIGVDAREVGRPNDGA